MSDHRSSTSLPIKCLRPPSSPIASSHWAPKTSHCCFPKPLVHYRRRLALEFRPRYYLAAYQTDAWRGPNQERGDHPRHLDSPAARRRSPQAGRCSAEPSPSMRRRGTLRRHHRRSRSGTARVEPPERSRSRRNGDLGIRRTYCGRSATPAGLLRKKSGILTSSCRSNQALETCIVHCIISNVRLMDEPTIQRYLFR